MAIEEKDKKKAINCRFQSEESDEFFHWLNSQSNLTVALRNLVYHAIDLYGVTDFISPDTQKEVMRNTFILEAIRNERQKPINPFSVDNNLSENSIEPTPLSDNVKKIAGIEENKENESTNIYQQVNPDNL